MRKNIASVIDAFHAYEKYQDKTCSTDGWCIYSYAMAIAFEAANGKVFVVDRNAAPSATTRSHIDAVRKALPDAEVVSESVLGDYLKAARRAELEGWDEYDNGPSHLRGAREDFHADG